MSKSSDMDWRQEARDCARNVVEEFIDEIVENLIDGGETPKYVDDYENGDEILNGWALDNSPISTILEAAEFLDEFWRERETDRGLWDGQEPTEAIVTQAVYTFQNVVRQYSTELLESISEEASSGELYSLLNPEPQGGGCTPSRDPVVDVAAVKAFVAKLVEDF